MFIKIRYERQNNLGLKFSQEEFEKEEKFYETNIKPGITNEADTPTPKKQVLIDFINLMSFYLLLPLYLLRQFINQIHIPAFIGFEEGEVVAGAFAFADVGNAADTVGLIFFAHGEQGGV